MVTIRIENIYKMDRDSPYIVRIRYGREEDQFIDLKEGDRYDIEERAGVYIEEPETEEGEIKE